MTGPPPTNSISELSKKLSTTNIIALTILDELYTSKSPYAMHDSQAAHPHSQHSFQHPPTKTPTPATMAHADTQASNWQTTNDSTSDSLFS